jgi:hypothetical protein
MASDVSDRLAIMGVAAFNAIAVGGFMYLGGAGTYLITGVSLIAFVLVTIFLCLAKSGSHEL